MAKRSKTERVATAGARTAGSGVGAALSSPFGFVGLGLAAVIILIVIFRKDIGSFFEGLKFPEFPKIELPSFPDIKFPDFNFPEFPKIEFPEFPKIEFPEFPDFTKLFQQQQDTLTDLINQFNLSISPDIPKPTKMVEDTGLIDLSKCQCGATVIQDAFGNVFSECKQCETTDGQLPSQDPAENIPTNGFVGGIGGGLLDFLGLTPAQEFALGKGLSPEQEAQIIIPPVDISGFGGGPSFIGGTTTLGSNIVDTLSEVLQAFPNLSASQAANLLESNQGLTQTEFSMISPFNPSISSAGGDPEQVFNQASGGFSGLTPEQIAFILTGGNIQNF